MQNVSLHCAQQVTSTDRNNRHKRDHLRLPHRMPCNILISIYGGNILLFGNIRESCMKCTSVDMDAEFKLILLIPYVAALVTLTVEIHNEECAYTSTL